jgi:hypothetical protein
MSDIRRSAERPADISSSAVSFMSVTSFAGAIAYARRHR